MSDEYDFIKKWPLDFKGQNQQLYFVFKGMTIEECQEFLTLIEKFKEIMKTINNPKLTYLFITKLGKIRSVKDGFHNDPIVVGLVNVKEEKQ